MNTTEVRISATYFIYIILLIAHDVVGTVAVTTLYSRKLILKEVKLLKVTLLELRLGEPNFKS